MLEITILKTKHYGVQEARKLLPHIKNSDVVSLEETGLDRNLALEMSRLWAGYLESGMSRTQLREKFQRTFGTSPERNYLTTAYEYMYRNNVALYCLEQYAGLEGKMMSNNGERILTEMSEAAANFVRGAPHGQERLYAAIKAFVEFNEKRENVIADTITRAENDIRSIYPWLNDKPVLRFGIQLGGGHLLEHKISGSKTVDLCDLSQDKTHGIFSAIRSGASSEQMNAEFSEFREKMLKEGQKYEPRR